MMVDLLSNPLILYPLDPQHSWNPSHLPAIISFSIFMVWNSIFLYGNVYQRIVLCNSILKGSKECESPYFMPSPIPPTPPTATLRDFVGYTCVYEPEENQKALIFFNLSTIPFVTNVKRSNGSKNIYNKQLY